MLAAPFYLARLEITGPSVQMLENVYNDPTSGDAVFSVGADGTLVYVPAPSLNGRTLVWVAVPIVTEPAFRFGPPRELFRPL